MLQDSLNSDRLFAIFNQSTKESEQDFEEPPAEMGTLGVIRAAHENPDGTSNLALQGIIRIKLLEITREEPYRMIRVEPCEAEDNADSVVAHARKRKNIINLLSGQPELTEGLPDEYMQFLYSLNQPSSFLDVAIHSICKNSMVKQHLLETLSIGDRFNEFIHFLQTERQRFMLYNQLQGSTRPDEISLN
jgi:ATP-dependent Lon protease